MTTAIQKTSGKLRASEKFKAWVSLFLDKSNLEYWGNATKCALKVYDTDNYHSAGQIGYENLKKLEKVAALVLEKEDFSFGRLMRIGAQKMEDGSYDDWEKFMQFIGYFPSKSKIDIESEDAFNFENLNAMIANDREKRGLKSLNS